MSANRIMIIGEKETFLIKVLEKKIEEAGFEAVYASATVNRINEEWNFCSLITYYMDSGDRIPSDVLRFLTDKMTDDDKHMIVIGEQNDIAYVSDNIPSKLIYKTFCRPLDNTEYIRLIKELFDKIAQGAFKKSILIVDDDPNYLGLVREWLKDFYKVSMATSGLQALKWLGMNKADLILLDHEMPVTTGPQVLEMLRSDPETRGIPVIFLTGKSDKESVMAVVALKPEGYFLKNISKEELLQKIDEFFTINKG